VGLRRCYNVRDVRKAAALSLPKPVFDYLDGGAEDEVTLRRNTSAFSDYEFIPGVLRVTKDLFVERQLMGRTLKWPLVLSPTGLTRIFHYQAELAVARAADRHGVAYSLSALGTTTIEEVSKTTKGPKLFQIYIFRDRGLTAEFVARAKAGGYDGLILTVDTPVAGNRERDRVSGLSLPPRLTLKSMLSFALHPRWAWHALSGRRFSFANVEHRIDELSKGPTSLFRYVDSQFDPLITWKDVEWLASEWQGPLAVKGVLRPEDSVQAVNCGATAVMISNHGGRQLDGAAAPISQIAATARAVGGRAEIICDGGIRRGSDIVKALALGATACSIGRPYLYGLAVAGERGVDHVLSLLRSEFMRTLLLLGVDGLDALPDYGMIRLRSQSA
jgi:L-lactate dehydrogenase (cytochrome)